MMRHYGVVMAGFLLLGAGSIQAQISFFPYTENFDEVTAPALPQQWFATGFVTYASSPKSTPNCVSTTGNRSLKTLTSPVFDFTDVLPDKLTFYERRTSTASAFRLQVCVSFDGMNFTNVIAEYDTIASTSSYVQRVINLANAGLQNKTAQFRWQILADSTNNTGVLRIDDISLTTMPTNDIALSHFVVSPSVPHRSDSLKLSVTVKNNGASATPQYSIHFYLDANNNGIAEPGELFSTMIGNALASGDSMTVSVFHSSLSAGTYRFLSVASLPQDQNSMNDTAAAMVTIGNIQGDILVNEIMYAPSNSMPEWIEFINNSNDTINLNQWKITDYTLVSTISENIFIPPKQYFVLGADTAYFKKYYNVSNIYAFPIHLPQLNNTGDQVVIFDQTSSSKNPFGSAIDSVAYSPSWGGQNGKSLERIDLQAASTLAANWGTSQDSIGSTPGKLNSIARLDCDIALSHITQTTSVENGNVVPEITATIRNIGRRAVDTLQVVMYTDSVRKGLPDSLTLLAIETIVLHLAPMDSLLISKSLPMLSSGSSKIFLRLSCSNDQRTRNDTGSVMINVAYPWHALVINEIMFNPLSNQNEWIEFYNASSLSVDLHRWSFCDRPTASGSFNQFTISDSASVLLPQHYVVVAADSTILTMYPELKNCSNGNLLVIKNHSSGFGFNDDGDAIQLKDLTGKTIDSVAYLPSWHNPVVTDTKGRSLERINPLLDSNDPHNWSTCTNSSGGTPGKVNSIFTPSSSTTNTTLDISPNPFSPDGDGFEDNCMISYHVPMTSAVINIRIFDIKGRLIRTLANMQFGSSSGNFIWNGMDDKGQRVRIGVYIILFEANDSISHRSITAKKVAVVATKL
ncbi:MAG TPA: lamin tail domain-containing protein [Bacteroidota bacterium]|nr:lamin tail domain-containing protein [Bacteroidota bacterium]